MKLSPTWLREFVDAKVDDRRLAQDLTSVGIAVESISGEGKNAVFEMEIGTNRPDAMNHYGVAREASVIYNLPLRAVDSKLPAAPDKPDFIVEIADQAGCARYTARVVRDVKIKPSPEAIAKRLLLVDQRPINNAADATNYTLWEMGHPTHVFDLDLLEGGKILVRRAFSGETLKTLDGVERKLTSGRSGHRRRCQTGCAGRSHGRIRHHDHGEDEEHSHRGCMVRSGYDPPQFAPPRAAYRRFASL